MNSQRAGVRAQPCSPEVWETSAEAAYCAGLACRIAGLGFWRLDAHTLKISGSAQMRLVLGLSEEAALDLETLFAAAHIDDARVVVERISRQLVTGEAVELPVIRIFCADGEIRMVATRTDLERDDRGAIVAVVGTAVDVTEQHARERRLTENEAKYRAIVENSTDIIVRFGPDGLIRYVSPACRVLGMNPQAAIGEPITAVMAPEQHKHLPAILSAMFSGAELDKSRRRLYKLLDQSGRELWFESNPTLVRNEAGDVIEVLTTLRDVTASLAVEAALAESEARYRMLADQTTDIIVRYDMTGTIEYASPAVRLLGYRPDDLISHKAAEFYHPDDRAQAIANRNAAIAGSASGQRGDIRVRRADGGWVWMQGNPTPIRNEAGEVIAIMSALRDVTARRAMEEELNSKRAEAEAAAIAKAEFLANMSHEIRTPLNGIVGFAGLLEKMEGLPETAQTYLSRIATGSQALLSVVNDVLDFSKIEAGQVDLDPQPFDPVTFVADTLELLRAQANNKGIALELDVRGVLPATVRADAGRVRQVLLNLVGNAIKFTAHGRVSVAASYLEQDGGALRIEVADTGVGIPAQQVDRLFQRFSQVDGSVARQFGGTGLGLAISKRLTVLLGGDIGVESMEGRGSKFWFTVAAPVTDLNGPLAIDSGVTRSLGSARILIVDDIKVNRELVSALLSPFDLELVEASSGAEAVGETMRAAFDLILMDLQMPGMDGFAATQAIRTNSELNRRTPILALSANVLPAHTDACREAGMDGHIAKPINSVELLSKIAEWTNPGDERSTGAT